MNVFSTFYRSRTILAAMILQSLRLRFTVNVLGGLWLFLYPLLFLALYATVFFFILGVRLPGIGEEDYILTIFCGLIPFLAFSEALSAGTASIIGNRSIVRNTVFPVEMLVAREVIVGHVTMGVGLLLVWAMVWIKGYFHVTQCLIPLIFLFQIFMTLGIVWITASVAIFFRDIQQAIPLIVIFLMLISPIGYTEEMIPHGLRFIAQCNPLAWLVQLYRACFLSGTVSWVTVVAFGGWSIGILWIGHHVISRLKRILADHV